MKSIPIVFDDPVTELAWCQLTPIVWCYCLPVYYNNRDKEMM